MVVNSCFEDLEGRVGLKRVWEFVPEVGKKRNERVKVNSDSLFWYFHQKGLQVDLELPAEIWGGGGHITDRAGGGGGEAREETRKTTDLPAVRDPKTQPRCGRYQ